MFSAIGHTTLKLKRIEYGPVQLRDLPFGQFRTLTPEEMEKLKRLMADSQWRIADGKQKTEKR
jgi:16S rRNA U516 pseudouridylate synthase RsuA-like enzyme